MVASGCNVWLLPKRLLLPSSLSLENVCIFYIFEKTERNVVIVHVHDNKKIIFARYTMAGAKQISSKQIQNANDALGLCDKKN